MLKLISKGLRENRVLECPQNISPKHLIIYKERNSNFTVGTYHVNQRTKVNTTSNKTW